MIFFFQPKYCSIKISHQNLELVKTASRQVVSDAPNKKEVFVEFCRKCRYLHHLNYYLVLNIGRCINWDYAGREYSMATLGLETEEPISCLVEGKKSQFGV